MAHYDIFRHNLATKYPACGHALWEPSTGGRYSAVAVGDVGFIRDGRFHRLFNVLLSPEDPSHRIFGVPEQDEQLRPHVEDHIITGTLSPNHFCSAGVTLVPESGVQANEPRSSTAVSFSCRRKQGGALLSLPIEARCEDTVALGDFRKWMINHIDRWFSWARELGVWINRLEDIVLVTGAHLTRSWTNVAFLEDQIDARVSFEFQVDADANIDWNVPPDRTIGALLNRGPVGKDLPEDQCIFIRGFRVTRKLMILPRTLKGAAGPNPDSKDPESDSDPEMELVPMSIIPEYQDHLHLLLEYIAESAPGCDMVLVHDNDLAQLGGFGDDTSLETLQPDAMATHLRRSKPEIHELLFHQDANAGTEPVRVAMLSGSHIFEERPPLASGTSSTAVARTAPLQSPPFSGSVARTIPPDNATTSHAGLHGTTPSDLLCDGFIARTFASEDANNYFMVLLRTPRPQYFLQDYGVVYHQGAWYIRNNGKMVQGTSPDVPFQPTPLLDYSTSATHGTVVPQRRWTPAEDVDVRRYVESATLLLPIFFANSKGGLGFLLSDILRGCDRDLHNANGFAPLGGKSTTHLGINWPGYEYWKRQIPTRDKTHGRNPITLACFMKHVGKSVDKFFVECISKGYVARDSRWQIGMHGGITPDQVKVIGAIHVSAGTWMPILQLTRYVI